ncbi:MAG: hypothetical protein KatS3mg105_3796 [Gemmatales bacterium]|nr:MAG: hypothetical protein KatS3mg105_3796 [Gemmatales bacterium]
MDMLDSIEMELDARVVRPERGGDETCCDDGHRVEQDTLQVAWFPPALPAGQGVPPGVYCSGWFGQA